MLTDSSIALRSASLRGTLDGPFSNARIVHDITAAEFALGEIRTLGLRQEGTGRLEDGVLSIPLALRIGRIETGSEIADAQLSKLVQSFFDLTPAGIIKHLDLLKPISL